MRLKETFLKVTRFYRILPMELGEQLYIISNRECCHYPPDILFVDRISSQSNENEYHTVSFQKFLELGRLYADRSGGYPALEYMLNDFGNYRQVLKRCHCVMQKISGWNGSGHGRHIKFLNVMMC